MIKSKNICSSQHNISAGRSTIFTGSYADFMETVLFRILAYRRGSKSVEWLKYQ